MRARKIWFVAVSVASILLILLIPIIYYDVLIPLDERLKNLRNLIVPLASFLGTYFGLLINKDSMSERSPFYMATRKDRWIGYLTGILLFFIICVIGLFVAPTENQALFMVTLGLLLWGALMYIFGSEELKNKLGINQSKKDTSVLISSGIIVFLILGVITFLVNLTELQGFLMCFLALGLWGGLIYVFGSDDFRRKIFEVVTFGRGGIFGVIHRWVKSENDPGKKE